MPLSPDFEDLTDEAIERSETYHRAQLALEFAAAGRRPASGFEELLSGDQDANYFINRLIPGPPAPDPDSELESKSRWNRHWFLDQAAKAEEAMTTFTEAAAIVPNSKVLVEVHGLPDNEVKSFTYLNPRVVHVGELVHVPAPEWSVRVTGRDHLPGYVLGVSDEKLKGVELRGILTGPTGPEPGHDILRDLVEQWEAEANDLYDAADRLSAQAESLRNEGGAIQHKANELTIRLDGYLGF